MLPCQPVAILGRRGGGDMLEPLSRPSHHAVDESDDYWCVPAHSVDTSNVADAGWRGPPSLW